MLTANLRAERVADPQPAGQSAMLTPNPRGKAGDVNRALAGRSGRLEWKFGAIRKFGVQIRHPNFRVAPIFQANPIGRYPTFHKISEYVRPDGQPSQAGLGVLGAAAG